MRLFVIPKSGTMIRHPKTKVILPNAGFYIETEDGIWGKYWKRRIACGDIIISEEVKADEIKKCSPTES